VQIKYFIDPDKAGPIKRECKTPNKYKKGVNKMNSTSFLDQFVVKGKGVTLQGKVLSIIIIIITAIALLGLAAYFGITASVPSIAGAGSSLISENPELIVAQRYVAEVAARGETLFEIKNPELNLIRRFEQVAAFESAISEYPNPELVLASRFGPNWVVNPELNLAQRYAGSVEPVSLYPNPELMFAQKFVKNWVVNPELNLAYRFAGSSAPVTQYPNPELALAQRYAVEGGTGSTQWVVNPELSIAQRFGQETYDGSFLATNPEIKIHLQYVNGG
jgi:hypothetical protein